jgi:hypothetical protein
VNNLRFNSIGRVVSRHGKKSLRAVPDALQEWGGKILLYTKSYTMLGLDSNGLRELRRIGFGAFGRRYVDSSRAIIW